MELRHLQHFIALVEEGSFTRAARRVNIVQSGISVTIRELEDELGSQLVERTTRKVTITAAGRLFFGYAKNTLVALGEGVAAVQNQSGTVRGPLRIGVLQSLGPYLDLASLLSAFQSIYPEVDVIVRALHTDLIPERVKSGELDLGFHALVDKEKWPGLEVYPLIQDHLVAICKRDHPLASRNATTLASLAESTFVDLTPERALRRLVDRTFATQSLHRNTKFEVSELQTALEFVQAGLGISLVPAAVARTVESPQGVKSVELGKLPFKWRLAILRQAPSRAHFTNSALHPFLELLASTVR